MLGEEHPDTLTSMDNLAFLYRNQGKYAEAEPLYTKVLECDGGYWGRSIPTRWTA